MELNSPNCTYIYAWHKNRRIRVILYMFTVNADIQLIFGTVCGMAHALGGKYQLMVTIDRNGKVDSAQFGWNEPW